MKKEKAQLAMPYIKLYTKDILANAAKDMPLAAFGGYVILLCYAWTSDPPATIPADEKSIRRIIGADSDEWAGIREQVLLKFDPLEGRPDRLVNHRLWKEWMDATEQREVNSKRGKAGAKARWNSNDGPEPEAGGFAVEEDIDA